MYDIRFELAVITSTRQPRSFCSSRLQETFFVFLADRLTPSAPDSLNISFTFQPAPSSLPRGTGHHEHESNFYWPSGIFVARDPDPWTWSHTNPTARSTRRRRLGFAVTLLWFSSIVTTPRISKRRVSSKFAPKINRHPQVPPSVLLSPALTAIRYP
jgi:hypothetical protein